MSTNPIRLHLTHKYLDPVDRLGEILFGVIMVLTVTLSAGLAADSGKDGVRELLLAAIGCNVAWGIIDGIMYIMSCITDRGGQARLILAVQKAANDGVALEMVRSVVGPKLEMITEPKQQDVLYRSILAHAKTGKALRVVPKMDDFLGALACFWLVFVSCLPAAVPFLIFSRPYVALRVSNLLMVVLLFVIGMKWGDYAYTSRVGAGLIMAAVGLALVVVAILLGDENLKTRHARIGLAITFALLSVRTAGQTDENNPSSLRETARTASSTRGPSQVTRPWRGSEAAW